jgi:hypothetical protein
MTSYERYNQSKSAAINDLAHTIEKDPVTKIDSYNVIVIESERLLKREQTFFIMNSIVTVGLIITLFQVI